MASAEIETPTSSKMPPVVAAFMRLDARQRMLGLIGAALVFALVVGGWLWTREPNYAVLFSNLSERDGGQIVTTLQQQNIPYKINDTGTAIMVPGNIVHDTRLRLASQGLPRGGLVGFELMENQKLGVSQFSEQINYQRALEGELARSIQSLGAIRAARVHLAIPKQTAFLRDEQKPSASVLVSLYPGRTLEPSQVAGIVHLVAASVPQLSASQVSLIDQDGNLISQPKNEGKDPELDPSQLKYAQEIEASYIKRIETILEPVVGAGNVRAQVSADIDFSQIEQVAETYKPNPAPETAVRSQQTTENGTNTPSAAGVPGALTNQPPVPATAPLTTPPAAGGANARGASTPEPVNFNRNATTNYELDKTVRHTKGVPGSIRRLSVAIVVNNKMDAAKGKAAPRTDIEMKQITDLAREAMGYSKERGDTLNVANAPFTVTDKAGIDGPPLWKDPWLIDVAKDAAKYLVLAVLAFLIWRRMLKPLLDRMQENSRRTAHSDAAFTAEGETAAGEGEKSPQELFEERLAMARAIAKDDPKLVAGVIKEWVSGSEPQ